MFRFTYLLAALLLCLTACATRGVLPSIEYEPPVIACEQEATPDGPDWPDNWLRDGPAFAIAWLGIATEERSLREIEHDCLAEHRKNKSIK